jgi:hypothetical protein
MVSQVSHLTGEAALRPSVESLVMGHVARGDDTGQIKAAFAR